MSPNTVDQQGGGNNSPLTSPPATPLSVVHDQESNTLVVSRKRTISLSRFNKDNKDESRCCLLYTSHYSVRDCKFFLIT